MPDMYIIKNEIELDPDVRNYASMGVYPDYALIAADMNINRIQRNILSLNGDDLFQATDSTEWNGLSDISKQLWMSFCGRQQINPHSTANVAFVQNIFGGGSNTISTLNSLRIEFVSFAKFHGFSEIFDTTVKAALNLPNK